MRNFARFSCVIPSVLVKLLSPDESICQRKLHSGNPRQKDQNWNDTLWTLRLARCGTRLAMVKMLTPYKSICQETLTEVLQNVEAAKCGFHVM